MKAQIFAGWGCRCGRRISGWGTDIYSGNHLARGFSLGCIFVNRPLFEGLSGLIPALLRCRKLSYFHPSRCGFNDLVSRFHSRSHDLRGHVGCTIPPSMSRLLENISQGYTSNNSAELTTRCLPTRNRQPHRNLPRTPPPRNPPPCARGYLTLTLAKGALLDQDGRYENIAGDNNQGPFD